MQDEVNEKVVSLAIKTSKLTAEVLQKAMKALLAKGKGQLTKAPHGKITMRQLMKPGEKVSNIEITDQNIKAFDPKPDSFRASVLRGVMHFVELYHGEFSEERLIRALGNVHPMEIYRVGRDNPAKLPGWKKYVFPIYMAYNGKGRKDALSMKF